MSRRRNMPSRSAPSFATVASQRGAALYVALVILILLALMGIVGMQVSVLQEKMSANYRNTNVAFQNAEASARRTECFIEAQVNRETPAADCTAVDIDTICTNEWDASEWAQDQALPSTPDPAVNARSIGQCISGYASLDMGKPISEDPNQVYQVTVYAVNDEDNPTADAAVDTIFIP
ncbi:MAG: PilX N-terminal domain-containing pilus assembly protein [Pseudoxanthomonas sp.]